jgi:hypothetical protein
VKRSNHSAAIMLAGCGSDTKTEPSTSTSASKTTSARRAPSSRSKVAPRNEDAKRPNPTIATYIAQNNVKATPAGLHPMHLGGVRLSVNLLRTSLHKDHPHRFECA